MRRHDIFELLRVGIDEFVGGNCALHIVILRAETDVQTHRLVSKITKNTNFSSERKMTSIKQQKPPVTIAHLQDVQAATKLDRLIDQPRDPESENSIVILLLWKRRFSPSGCSLFHATLFSVCNDQN